MFFNIGVLVLLGVYFECLLWECKLSNSLGFEAAVDAAAEFMNKAVKLVMVAGPKLRVSKAGKLKPNLDRFNNQPDWQEILTYFRGSELQNYFTCILEDNLKVT